MDMILGRSRLIERQTYLTSIGFGIALLAVRLFLAMPFWNSGLTKWTSFPLELSGSAKYLFANEFMLYLPGGPYPMPLPTVMAWLSGFGEIVLPILLVLGFLTRPAALGLLAMTLVIQVTIPGGWPLHLQWALAAAIVLYLGPGMFSLDETARRFVAGRARPAAS